MPLNQCPAVGGEDKQGREMGGMCQTHSSSSQCWRLSMRLSRGDGMTFRQWQQTHKHTNAQCACFPNDGAPLFFTEKT